MKIFGHPRSGCNFAVQFVAEAFYPKIAQQRMMSKTGHWSKRTKVQTKARSLWGNHKMWSGQSNCIYVLRDVRDVALSFYRTKEFQHKSWRGLSFGEFIRKPLDWYETPGRRVNRGLNIIQHWKRHLESWPIRSDIFYLRYERLLTAPRAVLKDLEGFLESDAEVTAIDIGPVAPFPGEDFSVSKWSERIDEADLTFILSIVGDDHWGLWNE